MKLISYDLIPDVILSNPDFYFRENKDTHTDNIISYKGSLKDIFKTELFCESNRCIFQGSVHKYFCEGKNSSDFTYSDMINTIDRLYNQYYFSSEKANVQNVEFGVNIKPNICCKRILDCIKSYKGHYPEVRKFSGTGYLVKFCFQQYEIKIYDKGFQYRLKDNILRVEIKVKKMVFLNLKNPSLEIILKKETIDRMKIILVKLLNEIILYEPSLENIKVKNKKQLLLEKYKNPSFWNDLKGSKQYSYHKANYTSLVNREVKKSLKKELIDQVSEKWDYLLSSYNETELDDYIKKWKN